METVLTWFGFPPLEVSAGDLTPGQRADVLAARARLDAKLVPDLEALPPSERGRAEVPRAPDQKCIETPRTTQY